jgi:hypothetical protein
MYKFITLNEANDKKHKWAVTLKNLKTNRYKTIKFGAYGMDDYTITKDDEQKERYIDRHKKNENWDDPSTAGFWSKHLSWNEKSIHKSLNNTLKKYNL